IDPSDHEGREQAWAEVKQNLAEETAEWVPKGRELVALFEHARRAAASSGDRCLPSRTRVLSTSTPFATECWRAWTNIEPFSIAPSVPGPLARSRLRLDT